MLATLMLTLRGTPFIYQGQELGMTNIHFDSIEEINDISSWNHWRSGLAAGLTPEQIMKGLNGYSRDQNRTPFQWNATENAGFTTGKPWLKVNPNYTDINAEVEAADPNSVLSFYKRLIQFRKNSSIAETLSLGNFEPVLLDESQLIAYWRRALSDSTSPDALVICNYQNKEHTITLPTSPLSVLFSNYTETVLNGQILTLKPYQSVILA